MDSWSQDGDEVSHRHDIDDAKARGVNWLSNLFFGTNQEATVELLPELSETIFNKLRDKFQVHIPLIQIPELSEPHLQ